MNVLFMVLTQTYHYMVARPSLSRARPFYDRRRPHSSPGVDNMDTDADQSVLIVMRMFMLM